MEHYDHIILGFGKGGKTLAGALAAQGQRVALVERSRQMFGGTCINVACIPTKFLEYSARQSAAQGGSWEEKAERYRTAIAEKRKLTAGLRQKNYEKATMAGVKVLVGTARFLDSHRIAVELEDGKTTELWGEQIFINTGARPYLPPIAGLEQSRFVFTSETLMELEQLPRQLFILGGGYIGMEFASYFTNFGSQVIIVQDGPVVLPREDREIAAAVLESMERRGVRVLCNASVQSIQDGPEGAIVTVRSETGLETLQPQAVLVATGRRPNVKELQLASAGVALTDRGAIQVNQRLQTSVPHIWAIGDVTGGQQFTYLSLDDSRIVKSQLFGDGARTLQNRGVVPYSVFLDPPLSRVGLTEEEARIRGYAVKLAVLPAAAIPKAKILRQTTGLLKAVVDAKTDRLLGVHLFCAESHEMINQAKLMMDQGLPYTVLRDAIFTHPTMSEAWNDLFSSLR